MSSVVWTIIMGTMFKGWANNRTYTRTTFADEMLEYSVRRPYHEMKVKKKIIVKREIKKKKWKIKQINYLNPTSHPQPPPPPSQQWEPFICELFLPTQPNQQKYNTKKNVKVWNKSCFVMAEARAGSQTSRDTENEEPLNRSSSDAGKKIK